MWLEDLYVAESVREHGVGRMLMANVARTQRRDGCAC